MKLYTFLSIEDVISLAQVAEQMPRNLVNLDAILLGSFDRLESLDLSVSSRPHSSI